jgi:preprotein translocase subunit SecE
MGRLLKKKPTALKRKKLPKEIDAGVEQDASKTDNSAAGLTLLSSKEVKRKPVVVGRKAPIQIKPVVGPVKKSVIDKSLQFLREVKVELKKVTWPSRKQTVGSTIVVLVLVMLISLFLGGIDIGLSSLVQLVLQ